MFWPHVDCSRSFFTASLSALVNTWSWSWSRSMMGGAKLYPPTQVETMLKDAGFFEITFRPIGMFINLWRNRELMDFANKHRDILSNRD